MKEIFARNLQIALEAVAINKVRSFLTALGIIFGVAAVIAMLAIGSGAKEEILSQMELVGVNNIVIEPVVEQVEEEVSRENGSNASRSKSAKKYSPGLNLADVESIRDILPSVEKVSPEIILNTHIITGGMRRSTKLIGITPNYFEISDFNLIRGNSFTEDQIRKGMPVCILGNGVASKYFSNADPVGKQIKVGTNWLRIIGVLESKTITSQSQDNLGIRNYNMDIYTPIQTMLIRYENRSRVYSLDVERTQTEENFTPPANYHQVDKITVQVGSSEQLSTTADVLNRILKRRHFETVDYQISIPELLLKQQQRTKEIFNMVLGIIAGISLLVGGIGIMNIMLASVMERIKEIGIRMAIGASRKDIVMQFVLEAILISIFGGLVGVLFGVIISELISRFADIPTIISITSIIVSFSVAASVGLVFGILPARKAARQDPITSLRHE